jgi:hypothetical protein
MNRDWDLSFRLSERYLWALSVIQHHRSLASTVANELAAGWSITERVKRLASNEIELGMGYRRSSLGQVTYRRTKGTTYDDIRGSTDKDLRGICRSQYEYPDSAIGYWPGSHLGHVYIVPEPVGSAHLRFDDVIVLYELCDWWPKLFGVPDEIKDMTISLGMSER